MAPAYSLLDLAPIPEGGTAADALAHAADLARHAEALGYTRYWLAEHHNMPGIASAATAVVIGHVAAATRTIRVGAGGIMLPNHAPLQVAEAFGTLATLYPGRIDLGLGRAPGTDMATARALRRHLEASDRFPDDVAELLAYLGPARPEARVRAIPGEGCGVPVWILGSSLYGAQLAAYLGLPYAFASHFAPAQLEEAAEIYRTTFRPSAMAEAPRFMMAVGLAAAETDAEARLLRSSQVLAFARLRMGRPGKLPRPTADLSEIPDGMRQEIEAALACAAVGSPATVRTQLGALIDRFQPDEILLTGAIHDHGARKRSFEIAAKVLGELTPPVRA
ncbi:LLM class flavin-dependent oxidoreductase [Tabrizicola oligotrophica]|uniref:Luciferase-like monooxygenase n=1 Tax=Tabrizicola oligotrophica TaxID=2710650 RepID=A0A6M0QPU6_9RHOB|nr:LLM class flavin-dependent oxidoreductase [Tabrizicola oligotrophica]NEY88693.1 LLM class flavin-dependent oxidoreductase [Tabrizicola oligotrophica]